MNRIPSEVPNGSDLMMPYYPILKREVGSIAAAILISRLEYYFTYDAEGFSKFLEPPQNGHPNYEPGTSWTEELAFSKEEFRTAFDKIGIRWSSKSQYEEAKAKGVEFSCSYYCSYFDRKSGLTFYFRNHEKVDALFALLGGAS